VEHVEPLWTRSHKKAMRRQGLAKPRTVLSV
jgi:hypothetical protein